jgi:hypothetical protein
VALAARGKAFSRTVLAPEPIAERYAEAIEGAYAAGGLHAAVRAIRADPACRGANAATLGTALAASFPLPGPRALFVDGTALVAAGGEAVLRAWLGGHPPAVRVHPVHLVDGALRLDAALACGLLGLAPLGGAGELAEPQPGDVVLCDAALAGAPEVARLALGGVAVRRIGDLLPCSDPGAALARLLGRWD